MKIYHYCLVFCLFTIGTMLISDTSVLQKKSVSFFSENADAIFDKAVNAAVNRLRFYTEAESEKVREEAVEAFFDSLYASFGIVDNPDSREKLKLYVPVIAIAVGDGFFIYYDDLYQGTDGLTHTVRRCTEKQVFSYFESDAPEHCRATDFIFRFLGEGRCYICDTGGICQESGTVFKVNLTEDRNGKNKVLWDVITGGKNYFSILKDAQLFEEIRTGTGSQRLEDALTYYCNRHNAIAQRLGVTYGFSVPAESGELFLNALDGISFIAFFQGYPISGTDEVFNLFSVSNARVAEVDSKNISVKEGGNYE